MICDRINDVIVEYIGGTPGDQFGICGNNEKARKILGWEPKISFEEGMDMFITYAKGVKLL